MKVVYSSNCLKYEHFGHPESPFRVKLIFTALKEKGRFQFLKPKRAKKEDILLVHHKSLIQKVEKNNIFSYALLSAGGAICASELAVEENCAFSLFRPPGHHAGRRDIGGFCYFNNIAIAVARLLKRSLKVAILDIDAHHGNGTQDIFLDCDKVVFCSLHQSPLYPGTGLRSVDNCYNFVLLPGTRFDVYKRKLLAVIKRIKKFSPQVLAVSLGFDTYAGETLADIKLENKDYYFIGKIIKETSLKTFFVLEGGYSQQIGRLAESFFRGFSD